MSQAKKKAKLTPQRSLLEWTQLAAASTTTTTTVTVGDDDDVDREEEEDEKEENDDTPSTSSSSSSWLDDELALIAEDNGWKPVLLQQAKQSRALFAYVHQLPISQVLPARKDVFNAFKLCPLASTRVVILGQDPYHGPHQAHGLSFSVKPGVVAPPSLKNIFKEAKEDLGVDIAASGSGSGGGDLSAWAQQGVLLLNTLLTVEPGKPNAHKKRGWEQFTDACIAHLAQNNEHVVFILWGKPAQEKAKLVMTKGQHLVINSSHPSPLGAYAKNLPFFGSKCFSRCNAFLKEKGLQEIDWSL